ncbi:hypothetical protein ABZW44_40120 [Streptomyces mirabilis]
MDLRRVGSGERMTFGKAGATLGQWMSEHALDNPAWGAPPGRAE